MKKLYYFLSVLALASVTFLGTSTTAKACDQTDIALDSVTFDGVNYSIYITFCLGGGEALPCGLCPLTPCTACANGADGDTRDFAIGFFGNGGNPITVLGFSPNFIVGDSTGCANYGFDVGPQGAPFNSQATVYYAWDQVACYTGPGTPRGISCLVQASGCGYAHQQCWNMSFTVDILPDSLRLFGAEGQGLPTTGCFPSADMAIDFTGGLPVDWGDVEANAEGGGVRIDWSTLREVNNDFFRVERQNGTQWEVVGKVQSEGQAFSKRDYTLFDAHPQVGLNQYRVVQVDLSGATDASKVVAVTYTPPAGLVWTGVGPVPAQDYLNIGFSADQNMNAELEVVSLTGAVVLRKQQSVQVGQNSEQLDLRNLGSGVYYLRLRSANQSLEYKFLKM